MGMSGCMRSGTGRKDEYKTEKRTSNVWEVVDG